MYQEQNEGLAATSPIFIVGTGRCGSTMISNMLREHPAILSLSEFFTFVTDLGSLIPQAFPQGVITASQFWSILSTPYHKQNLMLRCGIAMDEVLYPYASPTARFNGEIGVPALLQTTLPHLTSDHDALFAKIHEIVATFPPAPIQDHYAHLFTWLQQHFGRQLWVERSGSSLRIIARLVHLFPHARFVHIVRDGRDCALSMSKHYGFRMVLIAFYLLEVMGCDPYEKIDRSGVEDIPEEIYPFLPEHFNAEAFRNYEISPSIYGHYWTGELMQGLSILAQLPPERVLTLHFENFLVNPEQSVKELMSFIHPGFVDAAWIRRAISLIRPVRSSWQMLPPHEQKQLEAACQAGFAALVAFQQRALGERRKTCGTSP
jgi:putative sulfotransferase